VINWLAQGDVALKSASGGRTIVEITDPDYVGIVSRWTAKVCQNPSPPL